MLESGYARASLAIVVAAALIVAVWVSVEDLSSTVGGEAYCKVDGRRVSYAWAVLPTADPERIEVEVAAPCTLQATVAGAKYVLPGEHELTVLSGEIQGGEAHDRPEILDSPVMTGYSAVGLELLALLASVAYFGVVLLVWLG